MSAEEDPKKVSASVSVGASNAQRDSFVIGHVEQLIIQLWRPESAAMPTAGKSSFEPPASDPRPNLTRAAIGALRRRETCIYLGRRYGLTPHARLSWQPFEEGAYGALSPGGGPLCDAMSWLANQVGQAAGARNLSEIYGQLDQVEAEAEAELRLLAPLAAGHVIATGSYSARIQAALGPPLIVVQNDSQVPPGIPHGANPVARLLMLHGSEHDFQNALLGKTTIHNFARYRPALSALLANLLHETWIVLGAEEEADRTFYSTCSVVCCDLGLQQRPIFVVDPRPEEAVAAEWPHEALRHLRMSPTQFLEQAKAAA